MPASHNRSRRSYLRGVGAAAATGLVAGCTDQLGGSEFPSESITLLNPYPPGGGTDVYFSAFVDPLSEEYGVDVTQEYEAGADGAVAHREIMNSDSEHLLTNVNIPLHTLVQINLDDPGYDIEEFTGVCSFAWDSVVLITPADSEYTDFETLQTAYADGDLSTLGGVGSGNTFHMTAWQMRNKWDLQYSEYVGYDGGGSLISAVLRGEIPAGIVGVVPAASYVNEEEVNALLVAGQEPHPALPDVDTSGGDLGMESVESTAVFSRTIAGPPDLSGENQQTLTDGATAALDSDEVSSWSEESGNPVIPEGGDVVDQRLVDSFEIQSIYDEFQADTGGE